MDATTACGTRPASTQLPTTSSPALSEKSAPKFYRSASSALTPLQIRPTRVQSAIIRNDPPIPPSAIVLNNVTTNNSNFRSVILIKNSNTIITVPHTDDSKKRYSEIAFRKLDKTVIEQPTNFRHVKHVSIKLDENFDNTALEDEIKQHAGRRNDSIDVTVEDPKYRAVLQNFLETHHDNAAGDPPPEKIKPKSRFMSSFLSKLQRNKPHITKSDISYPTNFRHLKHIGANRETNFDHS